MEEPFGIQNEYCELGKCYYHRRRGHCQRTKEPRRETRGTHKVDNTNLRQENQPAQADISNLTNQNEQLSDKVAIASQLNATSISVIPLNKRGKECKKIKDVKKIAIHFTISRNVTTATGMRTLYLRITTPTGETLSKGGSFDFENKQLPYSIRKDIEYTGQEQAVSLYWDVNETLSAGEYRIDIFADGQVIGQTRHNLK